MAKGIYIENVQVGGNHYNEIAADEDSNGIENKLKGFYELVDYQTQRINALEVRISPILLPHDDLKVGLAEDVPNSSSVNQALTNLMRTVDSNTRTINRLLDRVDL